VREEKRPARFHAAGSGTRRPAGTPVGRAQARGGQGLHAGDDDAVRSARREAAQRPRAGRSRQRAARRRVEHRVSQGDQEGRQRAARESARGGRRSADGVGRIRAAQTRRACARRTVRRSGWTQARFRIVQGRADGRHVHLHEMSDADVLSSAGSQFRRGAEEAADRSVTRAAEGARAVGQRQLRSADRHAGGVEEARGDAGRRSPGVDVPHRRSRRHRSVRVAIRRPGGARGERSARHHAQPADGAAGRRRQAGQDLHRQRVDARPVAGRFGKVVESGKRGRK
jgi:hypothetical protein